METSEKEFAQIVREHKATIYSVCYIFADEAAEADDLFQDVLLNLWHGLPSFRRESNLRTWIYRVSLNTCISCDRRRAKRGARVPLDMDINLYEDTDVETEQVRMLHRRIQRLDVFDRAIVLLWLENISYDEIGAIVGISSKNVSVRLFRIKEKLKNMSNE